MKGLLLLIVFSLAVLSYAAITAEHTNVALEGYNWATKVCAATHGLCKYPHELGYGALGCGIVWLLMVVMK